MSLPLESLAGKDDLKMVSEDASEVILATAGYDHSIKFWQAHTGACLLTLQHPGMSNTPRSIHEWRHVTKDLVDKWDGWQIVQWMTVVRKSENETMPKFEWKRIWISDSFLAFKRKANVQRSVISLDCVRKLDSCPSSERLETECNLIVRNLN